MYVKLSARWLRIKKKRHQSGLASCSEKIRKYWKILDKNGEKRGKHGKIMKNKEISESYVYDDAYTWRAGGNVRNQLIRQTNWQQCFSMAQRKFQHSTFAGYYITYQIQATQLRQCLMHLNLFIIFLKPQTALSAIQHFGRLLTFYLSSLHSLVSHVYIHRFVHAYFRHLACDRLHNQFAT